MPEPRRKKSKARQILRRTVKSSRPDKRGRPRKEQGKGKKGEKLQKDVTKPERDLTACLLLMDLTQFCLGKTPSKNEAASHLPTWTLVRDQLKEALLWLSLPDITVMETRETRDFGEASVGQWLLFEVIVSQFGMDPVVVKPRNDTESLICEWFLMENVVVENGEARFYDHLAGLRDGKRESPFLGDIWGLSYLFSLVDAFGSLELFMDLFADLERKFCLPTRRGRLNAILKPWVRLGGGPKILDFTDLISCLVLQGRLNAAFRAFARICDNLHFNSRHLEDNRDAYVEFNISGRCSFMENLLIMVWLKNPVIYRDFMACCEPVLPVVSTLYVAHQISSLGLAMKPSRQRFSTVLRPATVHPRVWSNILSVKVVDGVSQRPSFESPGMAVKIEDIRGSYAFKSRQKQSKTFLYDPETSVLTPPSSEKGFEMSEDWKHAETDTDVEDWPYLPDVSVGETTSLSMCTTLQPLVLPTVLLSDSETVPQRRGSWTGRD